jgi:glycine cleavage system H lipoate-binding protein/ABC-type phosphate transport system substrate-binding protein
MKTRFYLLIAIVLLSCYILEGKENNQKGENTLNVFVTPGLYDLTVKWADEYASINPKLKIHVIQDNNFNGILNTREGMGFTDDESWIAHNPANWNMIVGRDIIVPVMNKNNPFRDKIIAEGITAESLNKILNKRKNQNQLMLNDKRQNEPEMFQKCYLASDSTVLINIENYLNVNNLRNKDIQFASDEVIISEIQNDPYAIGFCKLNHIATSNRQTLPENIELVPIDKNRNGKIDYMEDIYDNLQTFGRGVWIGKYPKELSDRIYMVSTLKPSDKSELAFLNWVLTDGQQYLNSYGHSDLVLNERQAQLAKIEPAPLPQKNPDNPLSFVKWILLSVLLLGIITLLWKLMAGMSGTRKVAALNAYSAQTTVFDGDLPIIPRGLFFDKTHTWAFMKKDGTVKVGIDDFLQHVTGRITRIELKKTGDKIKKGEHLLTLIQKGKQLDIYSPVSGTIREKNISLSNDPSLINRSPYKEGWVYKIEPKNWPVEMQFLNMADSYNSELKKEFLRLKDFFISALKANEPEYAFVLQDGGALKDNILEDLGPEIWDDFQTKFLDSSLH